MRKYLFILSVFVSLIGFAQNPKVPSTMYFGDVVLRINSAAQKKIQSHVDSYRRSPIYFQKKVELANLYFPIIEAKFKEENVPEDFKYLIIQESGFVSDAVSSSNAVGFWQFKKATGEEVGLTINGQVDERKNISRASTGAAKYFKSNNKYFGNWIYALQAYNQGAGGTQKDSDTKYYGKKKMDITAKTHWYVLKFLAHKIAYEPAIGGESALGFHLQEYKTKGVSLKEIAKKEKLDYNRFKDYNKWLASSKIPNDRDYIVLLTKDGKGISSTISNDEEVTKPTPQIAEDIEVDLEKKEVKIKTTLGMPDITIKMNKNSEEQAEYLKHNPHIFARINGLNVIKSVEDDTKDKLALAGGISVTKLLKYNDIKSFDRILENQYYYLQNKRSKAKVHFHTVKWNETLWGISQDYGIHFKNIVKKNRLEDFHELKAGRVLWLYKTRPKDKAVKFEDPGPKPTYRKKLEKKELSLPKGDAKLKKEVDKIIKEGIPHNSNEVSNESVNEEVKHDMEEVENIDPISEVVDIDKKNTDNKEIETDEVEGDVVMHTVKQGETLYGISKIYTVSVDNIVKWNRLKEQVVSVDQILIVEMREKKDDYISDEKPNELIHIVSIGETMYAISKKYKVSVENILKWNDKKDNSLSEGEKLKIKK